MANNRVNKKKKRMSRKKKKLLIVGLEILVLLILIGVLLAYNMLAKIGWEDNLTSSQAGINVDMNEETAFAMEGYTNIALFGLDNRGVGNYSGGNSDTIMIASINNETKDVKLVSIYRDTYLSIGGGKMAKANAAYAKGGAEQAVKMLNSNLDLNITGYVSVDWVALTEAIDALGGLDIEISESEAREINECSVEIDIMTGYNTPDVTESGLVHLDGTQSTAYARIRSLAGDDYQRTVRQRTVLQAMMDKAKTSDIVTLTSLCNDIFDNISTSLSLKQLLLLAKDVTGYTLTETSGFPLELTTTSINSQDTVVPIDLSNNVAELHRVLFAEETYTPSNTVQTISNNIVKKTGVDSDTNSADMTKYNDIINKGSEEGAN